jgi:hypothetical protein
MGDYKSEPLAWYQPNSNPLESYALNNMIDPQASAFQQIAQVAFSPVSTALGAVAGSFADSQMDNNIDQMDQYGATNTPYATDMFGNVVALGQQTGLLGTLFGGGRTNSNTNAGGGLFGMFGVNNSTPYGGYVVDGQGQPIRSGDGFLSYGAGPQGWGLGQGVAVSGTGDDQSEAGYWG